jgi:nitrate reductase NapAB chaperone NapD
LDDGNIKEQIGKAQPGSILRNLVLKVSQNKENWGKFNQNLKEWFGLELQIPAYDGSKNTSIICNYFMSSTQLKTSKSKSKTYEIIVAGSGFHQILILLSFYYGYDGLTTLLFDEPDAHLHNNLQRMVLNFFEAQEQVQFIVATHAPAMIQATNIANIISILDKKPTKIKNTTDILTAFTDVDNIEILHCQSNPYILYVEGNDDERILKNWANTLGLHNIFNNFFVYKMGGGNKKEMSQNAKKHFLGLKKFVPDVKRIILFDYDSEEESIPTNEVIYEWKRKNIDNYLLVQSAWHRVIGNKTGQVFSIDTMNETKIIDDFFENERLNLNKSENYRTIDANVFKMTDGKKMLFESKDSLFNQLKKANTNLTINRDTISRAMTQEELHQDIIDFFEKMTDLHNIEPEKSL